MKLKTKLFILLFILFISIYIIYLVFDYAYEYTDIPLKNKTTYNIFDDITPYVEDAYNGVCTKKNISTAMYTDGNYKNYWITLKIPPDDPYIKQAWAKGTASIAFESFLQRTTEWVDNNEYRISMYYYEDCENKKPIVFFQKQWVGSDHRVSSIQPLPPASKGKPIYIKYESVLGSFFFFTNGNDLRFFNNYLSVR